MVNTQLKKGVLDMVVLSLLRGKDYYGYELVQAISEKIKITEGTIYPLLRRLRRDELVETYLEESNEGAPRKYYKLSPKGEKILVKQIEEWRAFNENVAKLLELN